MRPRNQPLGSRSLRPRTRRLGSKGEGSVNWYLVTWRAEIDKRCPLSYKNKATKCVSYVACITSRHYLLHVRMYEEVPACAQRFNWTLESAAGTCNHTWAQTEKVAVRTCRTQRDTATRWLLRHGGRKVLCLGLQSFLSKQMCTSVVLVLSRPARPLHGSVSSRGRQSKVSRRRVGFS